ncbi:MAG: hypothetical protein M0P64_01075 [Candidatus Pacebacteria bacterium]|jgi:hypothetical protein|nr:hypothetical protein [Candidatus Paceibacterota bacterium]
MDQGKGKDSPTGGHSSFEIRRRLAQQRAMDDNKDSFLGTHPTATVPEDQRIKPVNTEKKAHQQSLQWLNRAARVIMAART